MEFLTLKQVSKKLGMSYNSVLRLSNCGMLPKRAEDGKWNAQEVETWRQGHKRYRNKKEIVKVIRQGSVFVIANEKNQRVFVDELNEFESYEAAQQALDKFAAEIGLKEIGN